MNYDYLPSRADFALALPPPGHAAPRAWLFDVDGTLTEPRSAMPAPFRHWMEEFALQHPCVVVSGGSWERVSAQVGPLLAARLARAYVSNGNEMRQGGRLLYQRPSQLPTPLYQAIKRLMSPFGSMAIRPQAPLELQPWLEQRAGMATLSWLPLHAGTEQRAAFEQWDTLSGFREELAWRLTRQFEGWHFQKAGQTSLDIFEQGADKSQVLLFEGLGPLWFFADAIRPGGNDWSLAQALALRQDGSQAFRVDHWEHTWAYLRALIDASPSLKEGNTLAALG